MHCLIVSRKQKEIDRKGPGARGPSNSCLLWLSFSKQVTPPNYPLCHEIMKWGLIPLCSITLKIHSLLYDWIYQLGPVFEHTNGLCNESPPSHKTSPYLHSHSKATFLYLPHHLDLLSTVTSTEMLPGIILYISFLCQENHGSLLQLTSSSLWLANYYNAIVWGKSIFLQDGKLPENLKHTYFSLLLCVQYLACWQGDSKHLINSVNVQTELSALS